MDLWDRNRVGRRENIPRASLVGQQNCIFNSLFWMHLCQTVGPQNSGVWMVSVAARLERETRCLSQNYGLYVFIWDSSGSLVDIVGEGNVKVSLPQQWLGSLTDYFFEAPKLPLVQENSWSLVWGKVLHIWTDYRVYARSLGPWWSRKSMSFCVGWPIANTSWFNIYLLSTNHESDTVQNTMDIKTNRKGPYPEETIYREVNL